MSIDQKNSVLSAYNTLGTKEYLKTLDTNINLDGLKDVKIEDAMNVKSKMNKVRKMDPYFEHINMNSKYQPRNQMNKTANAFMGHESPDRDGIRSTRVDSD